MNLKEIRISKGLNQLTASKIIGVPLRTYKRYEMDEKLQSSFKYQQMCSVLEQYNKVRKMVGNKKRLNIAVVGIGYVGLSLAILLANDNDVLITDVVKDKVDDINNGISPIDDREIVDNFAKRRLNLSACLSAPEAYINKDIVLIAVPTDFDLGKKSFNVENVISTIKMIDKVNQHALIVIKSTVPIGFTKTMKNMFPHLQIIFVPEFLREGQSISDNLHPSRIIIGADIINKRVRDFASILERISENYVKAIYMHSDEAEAVKLFSNAYLAMRVAFFNELDSYAKSRNLNTSRIIKGVSKDNRIGDYYNNPSFGYGGYCLPKDSEQLQNSFVDIPNNNIIKAIVESNQTRKEFIVEDVINEAMKISNKEKKDIVIGIYSLAMKKGSNNHRSSSSVDIMNLLLSQGIKVIVYDKNFKDSVDDLDKFKKESDLIITNRYQSSLMDVKEKLYTRDIYFRD